MRHQKASKGKMLHHNGMLAPDVWLGKEAEPWEETDDFLLAVTAIKEEAEESPPVLWDGGIPVEKGQTVIYNDIEYEVIQPHITQINWTPNIVGALYKKKTQPGAGWKPPTHAEDAYNIGATVTHDGLLYESLITANTTVPGSDARWWKLIL